MLWGAYRELCGRDGLRPGEPIEVFVGFVVRCGSASAALNMLRAMEVAEAEGFEACARVLLNWYKSGKSEAPVEFLLLEALKRVRDGALPAGN